MITDTMHPLTLATVSPPRPASFPLNQTETCPISSFEPDLRKRMPTSRPGPLSPVSPSETESCTTSSCTSIMTSSVSTFPTSCRSSVCNEIERRPRKGDDDYAKCPENAFILFRRQCCENYRAAQEEAVAVDGLTKKQHQADLSKAISLHWKALSPEERLYWEELAEEKKKEHKQTYPDHVCQPRRIDDRKGKKGKHGEEDSETTISFVPPLRKAVGGNVTRAAEPRQTTRVSTMEGRDLSASNLLEPTQETMIKMSIAVGQNQLQNLRRKAFFRGCTLRECLDVIRKDIVTIWNLHGLDHCLMDDKLIETFLPVDILGGAGTSRSTLRARMTRIKLDEPQFIPNVANEVANFVLAVLRMPYKRYQESVHGVEIFMSYIVNLICVAQVIFLLTPDHLVTRDTVDHAIDVWKNKREQLQISIKNLVKKQALRTLGQDQVLNEIETLIWQYTMSEQEVEELSQEVEKLGRKDETTKAGASTK